MSFLVYLSGFLNKISVVLIDIKYLVKDRPILLGLEGLVDREISLNLAGSINAIYVMVVVIDWD